MSKHHFDPKLATHELSEAQLTQIQGGTSLVWNVPALRDLFPPRLPSWISKIWRDLVNDIS